MNTADIIQHTSLRWNPSTQEFSVIDQRLLPFQEEWIVLNTIQDAYHAIQDMIVRGAPLIGVTAAYGLAIGFDRHLESLELNEDTAPLSETLLQSIRQEVQQFQSYLNESRPTAVNLHWATQIMASLATEGLDSIQATLSRDSLFQLREELYLKAHQIRDEDIESCRQIGLHGLQLIQELYEQHQRPIKILTHCNAGALACVEWGTATSPIYHAHQAGIPIEVFVDETRPRNQGAHLTAWEMSKAGIPHHLLVDNAGGHLMQHGEVDIVIVGSDRTTRTGDVANKIGTYLKALAAHDNQVPFYAALPSSTIDWTLRDGVQEIPIEERNQLEVQEIQGLHPEHGILQVRICPDSTPARNPGFDVTPSRLVTGIITERGIALANEESLCSLFPDLA